MTVRPEQLEPEARRPDPVKRVAAAAAAPHASEGAAAAVPEAAAGTSLATLLATHILRDGELVLLILKPSLWFVLFNAARFAAATALAGVCAAVADNHTPSHDRLYFELAGLAVAARVMVAVLQWMGHLYILTDQRILRITGIFTIEVFDCPLRKVARARLLRPWRDRMVGTGSIEIIPRDDEKPTALWQTIARPVEVHDRVTAAIRKARQSGLGD